MKDLEQQAESTRKIRSAEGADRRAKEVLKKLTEDERKSIQEDTSKIEEEEVKKAGEKSDVKMEEDDQDKPSFAQDDPGQEATAESTGPTESRSIRLDDLQNQDGSKGQA